MIRESIANYDYRVYSDCVEMEACDVFNLKRNDQNRGRNAKGHGDAVDADGNEVEIKSICPGSTPDYWCISHISKSDDNDINRVICKLETDNNIYWFDIDKNTKPEAYRVIVSRVRDHATFYANLETRGNGKAIDERTKLLLECMVKTDK